MDVTFECQSQTHRHTHSRTHSGAASPSGRTESGGALEGRSEGAKVASILFLFWPTSRLRPMLGQTNISGKRERRKKIPVISLELCPFFFFLILCTLAALFPPPVSLKNDMSPLKFNIESFCGEGRMNCLSFKNLDVTSYFSRNAISSVYGQKLKSIYSREDEVVWLTRARTHCFFLTLFICLLPGAVQLSLA